MYSLVARWDIVIVDLKKTSDFCIRLSLEIWVYKYLGKGIPDACLTSISKSHTNILKFTSLKTFEKSPTNFSLDYY